MESAVHTLVLLVFFAGVALLLYRASAAREMRRMMEMTAEEVLTGKTGPGYDHYITLESVVALLVSTGALVPVVGLPFLVASVPVLLHAKRKTPADNRLVISHWFLTFATGFTLAGLVISSVAVLGALFSDRPYDIAGLVPVDGGPAEASPFTSATLIAAVPAIILSVTTHECAHGLVALGMGDDTAKKARRLTLNPIRHIDPLGSVVLPLLLVLFKAPFLFGWARPVPVRADRLRDPVRGSAAVAAAGAGANFLLALASLGLFTALGAVLSLAAPEGVENFSVVAGEARIWGSAFHPIAIVLHFLKWMIFFNLSLGILNLIPLPPLDGARLLEGLWPRTFIPLYASLRPLGCMVLPGVLLAALCVMAAILAPALFLLFSVFVPFFARFPNL